MTEESFQRWKRNGNFTLTHDRILQVSNDIAEGMLENYTKKEAAEVATYHAMDVSDLINEVAHLRTMGALAIGQKMLDQVKIEKAKQISSRNKRQKPKGRSLSRRD